MKNKIRQYREKFNISQSELADVAGVSRATIQAVEAGLFVPSVKLAMIIALYLNADTEEIFFLEENE